MPVKNKAGQDLGTINDLVVELNSGEIRYAALSFGGFAGFGDKLFAVPWKAMTFKFAEDDRFFVLDATEDQLKRSKGFDENNWPNIADPKWAAGVDDSFKTPVRTIEREDALKPGERKAAPTVVYDAVFRVSKIKGMEVRNGSNKNLGHIAELVLDVTNGKISYAALSHGGFAEVGDKLFAIPFDAFKLKHTDDETFFVLNISDEKLQAAPGFNESKWPDTANPNWAKDIDRYYQDLRTAERPVRTKRSER
jgi:sporulation protein YlmC with PRC-barrel domain